MADAGSIGKNVSANAISPVPARLGYESIYYIGNTPVVRLGYESIYYIGNTPVVVRLGYESIYYIGNTPVVVRLGYEPIYPIQSTSLPPRPMSQDPKHQFLITSGRYLPSYHVRKRGQVLTCVGATDATDLINRKKDADLVPDISKRITMMVM